MPDPLRLGPPAPTRDTSSSSPFRRQQRGVQAAQEVLADRFRGERDALNQLLGRLQDLKGELQARLLRGVTSFRATQVRTLLADVDALMAETLTAIARDTRPAFDRMSALGEQSADRALRGAQVTIMPTAGLDSDLVTAAYENTIDLLSPAMQQFRSEIATSLRRVALAGDGRMEEIQRLERILEGQGFDQAQYRAERIVRTELGRTFNQAAYERFVALSAQAPYLRKVWRATNDSRTRRGHREAGRTYARGQGVKVAERFVLTHYDHRDQPTGRVMLRFPLDPQADPAGRLAAANTIMCRCSALIDFDPKEFGDVARQQLALALGPVTPAPAAGATPAAAATAPPAPAPPVVPVPPSAPTIGPAGPKVSQALLVKSARLQSEAKRALDAIDAVHGDGSLPPLDLAHSRAGSHRGQLAYFRDRGADRMELTDAGLQDHPQMTLFHEIGHWLDLMVIGKGGVAHSGARETSPFGATRLVLAPAPPPGATRIGQMTSADVSNATMQAWRAAVEQSATYQRLQLWARAAPDEWTYRGAPSKYSGYRGDGVIPADVDPGYVQYLLQPAELWARTYAQYIAARSGQTVGLQQLRGIQATGTATDVAAVARYGRGWQYPTQWSDDDFAGIGDAIDALFESLGWRISQ